MKKQKNNFICFNSGDSIDPCRRRLNSPLDLKISSGIWIIKGQDDSMPSYFNDISVRPKNKSFCNESNKKKTSKA